MDFPARELVERYDHITGVDTHIGSRRADVTVLPTSVADSAHRNYGHAITELERLERNLAKAFQNLAERTEALRESGTRAEPVFDAMPLVGAAHTAWIGSHVGEAPLGTPVA